MAVDLPVPVVPMSLKCLVSSASAIAVLARVSSVGFDRFMRTARRCSARPSTSTTPRLYVSCGFRRTNIEKPPIPSTMATVMKTARVESSMVSITLHDVVVRFLAIGGRAAVHAHAESRGFATAPQFDESASPFQGGYACRKLIASCAQTGDIGFRGQ